MDLSKVAASCPNSFCASPSANLASKASPLKPASSSCLVIAPPSLSIDMPVAAENAFWANTLPFRDL